MFRDVDTIILAPSNTDRGAEKGAERDAVAAFLALPRNRGLSLAGESENQGFPETPDCDR